MGRFESIKHVTYFATLIQNRNIEIIKQNKMYSESCINRTYTDEFFGIDRFIEVKLTKTILHWDLQHI